MVTTLHKNSIDTDTVQNDSGDTGRVEFIEHSSLSDGGKIAIAPDDEIHGYAFIDIVSADDSALVFFAGSSTDTEIIHKYGANGFTDQEDNDGTTNVYWDASNNRYELNNETGSSATYTIQFLRE